MEHPLFTALRKAVTRGEAVTVQDETFTPTDLVLAVKDGDAELRALLDEYRDALQECVYELELHEKAAIQSDDEGMLDRLNTARELLDR